MTSWNNAWSAKKDRRAQSSLYADDVQFYDATEVYALITKSDMDAMSQDPDWWRAFRVTQESSFVSADGRFAATLGKIALRDESGGLPWQPAASVLAVANDKIVWECDYYGGERFVAGQTTPMPAIPPGVVKPGSPAAERAIAEATTTIGQWLAAYNGREAASFLSFYAEDARYVDLVSPEWRVMTKSRLAADVASRFPRDEFQSRLEPSPGSAMDSAYFVSPDGRFAAVQGTYADRGTPPGGLPMLIVLELEAGEIVRQHNYVAMDRSLLEP
jgi:ketosteroid isomerase-like protein